MDICEKVAYIKGLAEGLALDDSTKEGKVLAAIIDVLGDITNEICEIEDGCDELMEQLDAVDEDLYEIECPACHDTVYLDEDMLEEDGITCPNCGTELEFDFDGCDCGCCHGEDDTDADEKE